MSIKYRYIYKSTNKINGKSYIGQTINFSSRKKGHIKDSKNNKDKNKIYFYNAIRKYNSKNFIWNILFEGKCHQYKINSLEIFFIAYYNTRCPNGYNLTKGGEGGWFHDHPNKKEIYKKKTKTRLKTLNKINPKTGLTKFQEIGKKISKSHNRVNLKTGLTLAQERGKKYSITMNKINLKTGLTKFQEAGLKTAKTLKECGSVAGKNNPRAKKYLLIAPNNQKIGAHGTLRKICKKYNLSFSRIFGHINKGKISIPIRICKGTIKTLNCTNWEIKIII